MFPRPRNTTKKWLRENKVSLVADKNTTPGNSDAQEPVANSHKNLLCESLGGRGPVAFWASLINKSGRLSWQSAGGAKKATKSWGAHAGASSKQRPHPDKISAKQTSQTNGVNRHDHTGPWSHSEQCRGEARGCDLIGVKNRKGRKTKKRRITGRNRGQDK